MTNLLASFIVSFTALAAVLFVIQLVWECRLLVIQIKLRTIVRRESPVAFKRFYSFMMPVGGGSEFSSFLQSSTEDSDLLQQFKQRLVAARKIALCLRLATISSFAIAFALAIYAAKEFSRM